MHRNLILRTAILGFATGLRTTWGIATLTLRANRAPQGFRGTPFGWLAYRPVAALSGLLAAGEVVGDKLPFVPDRIAPVPLLGKV